MSPASMLVDPPGWMLSTARRYALPLPRGFAESTTLAVESKTTIETMSEGRRLLVRLCSAALTSVILCAQAFEPLQSTTNRRFRGPRSLEPFISAVARQICKAEGRPAEAV